MNDQQPAVEAVSPEREGLIRTLVAAARTVIGSLRWLALAAAAAALLLWAALFAGWLVEPAPRPLLALLAGLALMTPPAGAGLAVLLLNEILALPRRIRGIPAGAAAASRTAREELRQGSTRRRVLSGSLLLWRLRGVLLTGRGTWLKAVGAARLASLASLPLLGFMAVSLLLCTVLVAAGGVAALLILLRAIG